MITLNEVNMVNSYWTKYISFIWSRVFQAWFDYNIIRKLKHGQYNNFDMTQIGKVSIFFLLNIWKMYYIFKWLQCGKIMSSLIRCIKHDSNMKSSKSWSRENTNSSWKLNCYLKIYLFHLIYILCLKHDLDKK